MRRLILFALAGAAVASAAWGQTPEGDQIAHGRQVFNYWCGTCHGSGIGNNGVKYLPGTNALAAKYKGDKPALLAERTDLSPEVVKLFVRQGITIMPFFRKTEVSDSDLDAIAAYLTRNNK